VWWVVIVEVHRDHDPEEARDGRHAEHGAAGGGRVKRAGISSQEAGDTRGEHQAPA
jgi:hypothetical protein